MRNLRLTTMQSAAGNDVANQVIVSYTLDNGARVKQFRSYDTVIAERVDFQGDVKTYLSNQFWDYSKTTSKYRNEFLNEGVADTRKRIKSGEYIMVDSDRHTTELYKGEVNES